MPWQEVSAVSLRAEFVALAQGHGRVHPLTVLDDHSRYQRTEAGTTEK